MKVPMKRSIKITLILILSISIAVVVFLSISSFRAQDVGVKAKLSTQLEAAERLAVAGKTEEAIKSYRELIDLFPAEIEGYEGLSALYNNLGQHKEADKVLEEGIRAWTEVNHPPQVKYENGSGGTPGSSTNDSFLRGNFPISIVVNQGEKIALPGTIVSSSLIVQVKISVTDVVDNFDYKFPNSSAFSMNKFMINTANGVFSKPGSYSIEVWVKTIDVPQPLSPLGKFTLVVKSPLERLSPEILPPASPPPILNLPSSTYSIVQGDSFQLSGTITSTTDLTRVSIGVRNIVDSYDFRDPPIGTKSFALSNFKLETSTGLFASPGTYDITISALSSAQPSPQSELGFITLIVNPNPRIPPTLNGVLVNLALTLGDKQSLSGLVSSPSDLSQVVVAIDGPPSFVVSSIVLSPGTRTVNLAQLLLDTASTPLNKAGSYNLSLWASSTAFPNPETPLGRFNLAVLSPTPPTISGFSGIHFVKPGLTFTLPGTITSSTDLAEITVRLVNKDTVLDNRKVSGRTYNLSSIVLDTQSGPLMIPGNYLLSISASASAFPAPSELGRITLVVK